MFLNCDTRRKEISGVLYGIVQHSNLEERGIRSINRGKSSTLSLTVNTLIIGFCR
jgi:hypothetical protein